MTCACFIHDYKRGRMSRWNVRGTDRPLYSGTTGYTTSHRRRLDRCFHTRRRGWTTCKRHRKRSRENGSRAGNLTRRGKRVHTKEHGSRSLHTNGPNTARCTRYGHASRQTNASRAARCSRRANGHGFISSRVSNEGNVPNEELHTNIPSPFRSVRNIRARFAGKRFKRMGEYGDTCGNTCVT